MRRAAALCPPLLALLATFACAPARTAPGAARAAAAENAGTPEGEDYDRRMAIHFGSNHAGTMRDCLAAAKAPGLAHFDIFIRLGERGEAVEVLVDPETDATRCVRERLARDRFPQPPRGGWWAHVSMGVTP